MGIKTLRKDYILSPHPKGQSILERYWTKNQNLIKNVI